VSASITFVIPTRNRAELAMRAVAGLLGEGGEELRVLVSDNSTDEGQAEQLAAFCHGRGDARLTYLRAPAMVMPTHWNWALERALSSEDSTHLSVHYDRKVPKPGRMRRLIDAIDRHPDRVVTYTVDQVDERPPGFVLWQPPSTGRLYEIPTARVWEMASEGLIAEMGHSVPILSNCAVPRQVFADIMRRFGDICDSTGPDIAFTFRFCALAESYLHLDASLGVVYATYRSSGAGYLSGKPTDFVDFKRAWGERPWLDAVPLPGLDLGWNLPFHEYELVRRQAGDGRFPPLSMPGYLNGLAYGLGYVEDETRRAELEALLEQHGWRAPRSAPEARPTLRERLGAPRLRQRVALFLAARLGVKPAHVSGFAFDTEAEAIECASRFPRRDVAHHDGLDWINADGPRSRRAKLRPLHGA
jgi:hypothetical protein